MTHLPLALKYRPATFADVISQEHVTRTLSNALARGRTAHAYLFAGPRGSGKTTTARLLAKALNCDRGVTGEPCGECENCRAIAAGRSLDVIEIDAASNRGIDDIKELREAVKYAPAQGRFKVYIVDEVHQLSKDAFNALLKTLEEPPRGVVFVLATTEPHKILQTILSRCQRFDFRPIPLDAIRRRLADIAKREQIQLDERAEFAIAKKADGSLRDALSLLDQVVAFGGDSIDLATLRRLIGVPDEERYLELTEVLAAGDAAAAMRFVRELREAGFDLESFYAGLLEHLRDCLLFAVGDGARWAEVPERYHAGYATTARKLGAEGLLRMLTLATEEEQAFRRSSQQDLILEVLLVRLALLDRTVDLDRALRALGAGGGTRPTAGSGSGSRSAPRTSGSAGRGGAPSGETAEPTRPTRGRTEGGQAAGPLTLESLLAAWDEVVEEVLTARPTVAASLKEARPSACQADGVTLTLPPQAEWKLEQLSARGMLDPLAAVLARRWGYNGRIRVEPAGEHEPGVVPAAAPAKTGRPTGREIEAGAIDARLQGDPLLRHVVDLFDASVVRVRPSS
ncbi:MAG TPA: DNA polymerase III subunit gamma/tau [Gemmatimonadota bacterium]|nr:DNA polymerase III subunit gamma/tau [Gemmatimonadota bacterium]